jgi:hypothetical protein
MSKLARMRVGNTTSYTRTPLGSMLSKTYPDTTVGDVDAG